MSGVISSQSYDQVYGDSTDFFKIDWFPEARLNFAENLLKFRDNEFAYNFKGETKKSRKITYKDLYYQVGRLATTLRKFGIVPGDCIASYIPNPRMIASVRAMIFNLCGTLILLLDILRRRGLSRCNAIALRQ